MKFPFLLAVAALVGLAWTGLAVARPSGLRDERAAQADFVVNCGGCHGIEGVSNSRAVPDLKNQVGYFLNFPEGRTYLARLPNVAFSTLPDAKLADALNFMAFVLGADSVPAGARPYSAGEVGRLRKTALTGAPLRAYRDGLVERLIKDFGAPDSLRLYGQDHYGAGGGL
jgi:hypothetical protein